MENTEKKQTKAQVFNVIILDKSGSMGNIRQAAVDGFNETLAGIKKAQEKHADTQDHFVSLLTFCDCEKKYVYDKVPVVEARQLTMDDYQPCCCTPLYDAMGFTLTSMRKHVAAIEDHVVVVTIITDGLENASKEYSGAAVNISIRNSSNFFAIPQGMLSTMDKDKRTRMNFFDRLADYKHSVFIDADSAPMPAEERHACYTAMADEAFDEENDDEV